MSSEITSVIIAYNEESLLRHTLAPIKSISNQVIIVDMGSSDESHSIYDEILDKDDLVLNYRRENLYDFGFAHPRNYGAKRAKTEWILAIDCDEYINAADFIAAKSILETTKTNAFDLTRLNYVKTPDFDLTNIGTIIESAEKRIESHRRLYRNTPRVRWEGMIHEELWVGDINAYFDCEPFPVPLHHLNQFKEGESAHTKFGLYSYLTLQAIIFPCLRYGTNDFWFTEFPKQSLEAMLNASRDFATLIQLPQLDEDVIRKQLGEDQLKASSDNA
ncbi:glycosyltransferase [Asticcacaulis sp. SL142]|uniref:glycosyltransferase n=1 Tax=Asticcacaulis sp. SL142 TaxID=2995155 RepID=UPI00226CDFAB|nr:glycosyltransferase [Asticcacaulis sp. SL142]WAC47062.1 glycosyltransferase [Asticcacaulis sp. SL142]